MVFITSFSCFPCGLIFVLDIVINLEKRIWHSFGLNLCLFRGTNILSVALATCPSFQLINNAIKLIVSIFSGFSAEVLSISGLLLKCKIISLLNGYCSFSVNTNPRESTLQVSQFFIIFSLTYSSLISNSL